MPDFGDKAKKKGSTDASTSSKKKRKKDDTKSNNTRGDETSLSARSRKSRAKSEESAAERAKRVRQSSLISPKMRADTPIPLDALKARKSIPRITINRNRKYPILPQNVRPKHYDINIFPSVDVFKFYGSLLIQLTVQSQTKIIVLNAAGLNIQSVTWQKAGEKNDQTPMPPSPESEEQREKNKDRMLEFISQPEDETLIIPLKTPIESGEHTLNISYSGNITENMKGFHFSEYKTDKLEVRYNYLTRCEPCDCRRVFPCFDEPQYKSTFRLTLTVPKAKTVVSNMPEESRERGHSDYFRKVTFETSRLMSTFMFGFIIGDFDYIQSSSKDGVVIRVYTPPKWKNQGRFALECACKMMDYMHDFIGQPFPLSKVDFVAVKEMSTNVQANWGLAIFRDDLILVRDNTTPRKSPTKAYQDVALLIAHAVAIQWLGNMITMMWWSDVWLSIGVATYIKFVCVNHEYKTFRVLDQFPSLSMNKAMSIDLYRKTHKLKMEDVRDPPDINDLYDIIAMDKAASVLRMVHTLVGDDNFRLAFNSYYMRYPNGTVKYEQFWDCFKSKWAQNIRKIMTTWCETKGFPLVTILSVKQEGKTMAIKVQQSPFDAEGKGGGGGTIWSIPLNIKTSTQSEVVQEMFDKKAATLNVTGISGSWFVAYNESHNVIGFRPILNAGQTGYFRVKYPKNILNENIKSAIAKQKMNPMDRAGIIQDLYALAMAGHCSVIDVLDFLPSYMDDKDYLVWRAVDDVIQELDYRISYATNDAYIKFHRFVLYLYREANVTFGLVGFEKVNPPVYEIRRFLYRHCFCCCMGQSTPDHKYHLRSMLFALIIRRQIFCGHKKLIYWAKNWFVSAENDERDLHADLHGELAMGFGLWRGSEEDLHILFREYRKAKDTETKELLIEGFSVFKINTLIRKILQFAISSVVPVVHTVEIMLRVGHTKLGRHMVWNFFKEHIVHFEREFFHNQVMLKPLFRGVFSHFMTQKMHNDIQSFFSEQKRIFQGLENVVDETLQSIHRNMSWAERDLLTVNTWLLKLKVEAQHTIHAEIQGSKRIKEKPEAASTTSRT